jgi:rubrerythrin
MSFNPLKEKGIPLENQIESWQQINPQPYDKEEIHPYTRTRIILMNGIEVEAAIFKHQFARHCSDTDINRQLALTRAIEQQQQKVVNWLSPADESTLEITIGYEQVAVDLTAVLARTEKDAGVKAALDFALLEDFDHLYRYANLMETVENKQAEKNVRDLTEIIPGRPTISEHRHPYDNLRKSVDFQTADILTKLHILTIVSAEQQTMNFYMNVGNRATTMIGRALYQEIGQVEEEHVSHYESLADPTSTWFEMLVLHEYNECYLYYSCLESEVDDRMKKIWQHHLEDEIGHLHAALAFAKKYDGMDPSDMLPDRFPELTIFQSNVDYVRDILKSQIDLTCDGFNYVDVGELDPQHRFHQHQQIVNVGIVPSQEVIQEHIEDKGVDYRLELGGEHPVERFRERQAVLV